MREEGERQTKIEIERGGERRGGGGGGGGEGRHTERD